MILLVFIFLNDTAPSRLTLFRYRYASTALVLTLHLRDIGLTVDQRSLTVLLASQISTQGKDILRSVLVHRRIGCRTDQCQGIDRIQHLDIYLLAHEQISRQGRRKDHGDHVTATDKRNTQQYDREDKGYLHPHRMDLVLHRLPDRPDQGSRQDNHERIYTRVIRHTERIDKQQLEITANLNQALYDTIHHQTHDSERHQ